MVAKRLKKYATGEGAAFMTRKAALKKLQLSIKDFRRLCILKGIYPREPRNRKRAQKGTGGIKTLYHTKDIQFLLHEPIIWKLREVKVYYRKIQRAQGMKDKRTVKRYMNNYPEIKIDHIVKERYPTFIDALRDADDCLTLCFLFSTFPSIKHVPRDRSVLCRRLTVEFMHAVIAAKALRKVFVSIKGYYYQAEIRGQIINWIVPHHFGFQPHNKDEVDFKLMSTFIEFYTVMLGFMNFRLFHSLNLQYPPNLTQGIGESDKELIDEDVFVAERVAAMNLPLATVNAGTENEEDATLDVFPSDEDPEKLEEAKKEADAVNRLKTLFNGLKFFINREAPREPMVFLIRCFGGEVSWDKQLFVGSTFDESDESITHQIVDRPSLDKQYISRYYIQPQWVFDSVNARTLLPISKYLMGAVLPPHLSPFIDKAKDQVYIPPEARPINEGPIEEGKKSDDSDEESDGDKEELDADELAALEKAYNEEVGEDSESLEDSSDEEEDKKKRKEMFDYKPVTMKLVFKSLEKDGNGRIGLIPEESEDMWHAFNLIAEGDIVTSSTIRKVQNESSTGSSTSSRVRTTLTIKVETIDFDTQACVLRLKGRNIQENQYVKMGAYHTLDLELNRKFTLHKSLWDSVALERVDTACDIGQNADLAAVVMQEGLAYVCLITAAMTLVRSKIDVTIPRKRKGFVQQHDKGLTRFYESVVQAILRHVNFSVVKCVLIASPGFVRDQFFEYMFQQAVKTDNKLLLENKGKFMLVHASSGFKHSLKEVLQDPAVLARMTDTKASGEVRALESFYTTLQCEPAKAFYGKKHIQRACQAQAIETLLISDKLFRCQNIQERKDYVAIVESVRENGGEAKIFSSMHISGEQLEQLTGVAAILRFPMPELEESEEENSDSE